MTHLYFNSSNLDYTKPLNEDKLFQPVYEYIYGHKNSSPWEYGRIKTGCNYIHLIIGNMPQENCAWCGSITRLRKVPEINLEYEIVFMECPVCYSCGPKMKVFKPVIEDPSFVKHIESMVKSNYSYRRPWDSNLKDKEQE